MASAKKTHPSSAGKSIQSRAQVALTYASVQAKKCQSWMELSNALYGIGGKCGELFPSTSDRAQFVKTAEYKQIAELMSSLPGPGGKAEPEAASGQLRVRMPRSVHAALIAEAHSEGVSLNQLILAKITLQLRATV